MAGLVAAARLASSAFWAAILARAVFQSSKRCQNANRKAKDPLLDFANGIQVPGQFTAVAGAESFGEPGGLLTESRLWAGAWAELETLALLAAGCLGGSAEADSACLPFSIALSSLICASSRLF